MNGLRIKKAPIVLPLLLLAIALGVYILMNFQGVSAADNVSLGQQRLNDLDYSGAVAAFSQAIELDPGNREARLGLAQAYTGSGSYSLAQQVLEEAVGKDQPDVEAAEMMVEIYRQNQQLSQAVQLAQTLILTTDNDEYYDLQRSILEEIYAAPRSVAYGTDQQLVLRSGEVLARGNNSLGQLGLDPERTSGSEQYIAAGFPGEAAKVACAGRTSVVIDPEGAVWAAGENRWGQLGAGYADTSPENGWRKIECPGPAAAAAGTTGRMLILLTDGTLWTAGADSLQVLSRLPFPAIVAVDSAPYRTAVLTADGRLYYSDSITPDRWGLAAKEVRSFSIGQDGLFWVGNDNNLYTEYGIYETPDNWIDSGKVPADFVAAQFVHTGQLSLVKDVKGNLYQFEPGRSIQKIDCGSPVAALYVQGDMAVLECEDGSIQLWQGNDRHPLTDVVQ